MFSLVITDKGGAQRQLGFEGTEVSIGRLEDNHICLPKNNVSKRHARLVLKDQRYVLIDMKSTNGTYVNGRRIAAPTVVRRGDKVYIGDFILSLAAEGRDALAEPGGAEPSSHERPSVQPPTDSVRPVTDLDGDTVARMRELEEQAREEAGDRTVVARSPEALKRALTPPPPPREALSAPPAPPPPREALSAPSAPPPPPSQSAAPPTPSTPVSGGDDRTLSKRPSSLPPRFESPDSGRGPATSPAVLTPSVRLQGALSTLMERLAKRMDVLQGSEGAFPSEHQGALDELLQELESEGVIGPELDRRFLSQAAVSEAVGLGPLDRLLTNNAVREVVVDGPARILADLGGGLTPVSSFFSSTGAVRIVAQRLMARAGRELKDSEPIQTCMLPDGSRLQVLSPPLTLQGTLISIRCPPQAPASPDGLVTEGILSGDMMDLMRRASKARQNVLVVGSPSAGVSTVLGALSALCQDHERLLLLEETPSMKVDHSQVLALSRAGAEDASLSELLRHAARLRCDRLVIDDIRPEEALALLTGAAVARGTLMGMHAPSPQAALEQLEMFAQLGLGSGRGSLSGLLSQAVQLLVHLSGGSDGSRRVQSISEVVRSSTDRIEIKPLWRFDGRFRATEHRAGFLDG